MSHPNPEKPERSEHQSGRSRGQKIPIQAVRVTKEYLNGKRVALDDVSVDIQANQLTALIGPSGCGKTTLLRLIAGLEYPTYGHLKVRGRPISGPGPDRGMVFQAYTSFPWLTAVQNVAHGMEIQGLPKDLQKERAEHFLRLVHLDDFADAYPVPCRTGTSLRTSTGSMPISPTSGGSTCARQDPSPMMQLASHSTLPSGILPGLPRR